jgi:hypothetical protein
MVMSMLHDLTPDQRHGETLAFRSMAINASSTVMPLIFGATGRRARRRGAVLGRGRGRGWRLVAGAPLPGSRV